MLAARCAGSSLLLVEIDYIFFDRGFNCAYLAPM